MAELVFRSSAGLEARLTANGALDRLQHAGITLNRSRASVLEGGLANLYLRRLDGVPAATPLLGPQSPSLLERNGGAFTLRGLWQGLRYRLRLALAEATIAWCWQLAIRNETASPVQIDLLHCQDFGLADYAFMRSNEYYVSHYLDHAPLSHAVHGWALAVRQNLPMEGRHPWCVLGSTGRASAFATDALQFHGLAARSGRPPPALRDGLPATRLQHEHALAALQEAPMFLAPGDTVRRGFLVGYLPDHPAASGSDDLAFLDALLALPEAHATLALDDTAATSPLPRSLFDTAPRFAAETIGLDGLEALYGVATVRERGNGSFHAPPWHVVARDKEHCVLRPHAQILRTGSALVPDEAALTTTAWMAGVFNSMLCQGHVGLNRLLNTQRGYLGLQRANGQRVFVETDQGWQLLDVPSAWATRPGECRWHYVDADLEIEVVVLAPRDTHRIELSIRVLRGGPRRFLVAHLLALDDDDGLDSSGTTIREDAEGYVLSAPAGTVFASRFGERGFRVRVTPPSAIERSGSDELLSSAGHPQGVPCFCLLSRATQALSIALSGELVEAANVAAAPALTTRLALALPPNHPRTGEIAEWSAIVPWFIDNALVHYLAPRGIEQYTGGGWGTRDICQGPLEMLLALGEFDAARDLLCRVYSTQNAAGDWPQWFSVFPRDRAIRAHEAHGDIVLWPLLALGRYLAASADPGLLDALLPFHVADGEPDAGLAPLWTHVERALAFIDGQRIAGTALIRYGLGDWNDAMQPANPAWRKQLCSSWTVALHYQAASLLGVALGNAGRPDAARALQVDAARIAGDFANLLLADGVVAGHVEFDAAGAPAYLLHPRDQRTGIHYSLLPMPQAILAGLLAPAAAKAHLALIKQHLWGPDGARLFDRPLPYHGGPSERYLRAESAAFFGREIGLMYTHAHLRYAEALALLGCADDLLGALGLVNPIGLEARLPGGNPRQSNCYYSSSDAVVPDRYAAEALYAKLLDGELRFEGGWRVYSSGPGLCIALFIRCLLGLRLQGARFEIDPVLPPRLDGLLVDLPLFGVPCRFVYRVEARGYGIHAVVLNGSRLAGRAETNPYREAGASFDIALDLRPLLREQHNTFEITLR